MIRRAAVAGRFYPASRSNLLAELKNCIPDAPATEDAIALMVPHAGYTYSGAVAGVTYARVRLPHRFVILCPNHTGLGAPISILSEGEWETPLGRVPIDTELANSISRNSLLVRESLLAHRDEHALEVHLPFLQFLLENELSFVPISVGTRRFESLLELGHALGKAVQQIAEPVLLISSSDMNHFESASLTKHKDQLAIERILALDSEGLRTTIATHSISMCGYGPTVAVIEAARMLGAKQGRLVRYSHSGEINGDSSSVVGYAGLVVS